MTEPEALVWAAAFVLALRDCKAETPRGLLTPQDDVDMAVLRAHGAVQALKTVRISGRHERADIRTLIAFRMDAERED